MDITMLCYHDDYVRKSGRSTNHRTTIPLDHGLDKALRSKAISTGAILGLVF
jgi:hypothetical protein